MFRAFSLLAKSRKHAPPTSHRSGLFVALCTLAVLTACEDPSNVGLGLVGDEQGVQPVIRQINPTAFQNEPLDRPPGSLARVLAGRVTDPLLGTVEADGYFDLSTAATSEFREKAVTSAVLRLRPEYTYGDTTQQVIFALRQIESEFSTATPLPVDTTIATGPVIREFSFLPTDTLLEIPMPEDWVEANESVLRSDEFISNFHGFKLEQIAGNAVIGFGDGSQLRAFADADSAVYPVSRTYSAMRRLTEADVPPDRLLMQAGVGPVAAFQIDLGSLDGAAINQAKLVFPTDTLTLSQKPVGFRRPIITTLDLYGILENGGIVLIEQVERDAKGRFIFGVPSPTQPPALAHELQRVLLETRTFEHFELRLPRGQGIFGESNVGTVQGSINVQLFYDTAASESAPEGFLTVTPLD